MRSMREHYPKAKTVAGVDNVLLFLARLEITCSDVLTFSPTAPASTRESPQEESNENELFGGGRRLCL